MKTILTLALCATLAIPAAASAQDAGSSTPTKRYRVGVGPQLTPKYPGSDDHQVGPYIEFSRARGDEPFAFSAPDQSSGFAVLNGGTVQAGPAVNYQRKRTPSDVGAPIHRVGTSVELGGFAQAMIGENFRLRGELMKGLGGHKGLVANASADLIARDGDKWLFAAGPRLTWADKKYRNAYFGVTGQDALASGLPIYTPGSGINSVGATASALAQLSPKWTVLGYAKYDRLIDEASRSPVVRNYGSRNQFGGGIALAYTFTR